MSFYVFVFGRINYVSYTIALFSLFLGDGIVMSKWQNNLTEQTFLSFLSAYELVPPVEPFTLPHQGKNNTLSGLHTGAGDLVWKNYTSSGYTEVASILYEHRLLKGLAGAGLSFAVPVPLMTRQAETPLQQAQDKPLGS